MRQAPPLTEILEGAPLLKAGAVVDERDPRLPGELDEVGLPQRDPFAEVLRADFAALQHLAGFQLDLADRRSPVQAGAFVEHAVHELEPLRERTGIVRIDTNNLVRVHGNVRGDRKLRGEDGRRNR